MKIIGLQIFGLLQKDSTEQESIIMPKQQQSRAEDQSSPADLARPCT